MNPNGSPLRVSRSRNSCAVKKLHPSTDGWASPTFKELSNDALFKIQSDVIRDIAARESCVFVGRCADYILRDHPRAVNVFVAADRADRCERLCRQCGITPGEAEARMDREDARRAAYYNYYSSGTWGMASTYHLCVDSSVLGIDGTVDFVLEFVERKLGVKPGAI